MSRIVSAVAPSSLRVRDFAPALVASAALGLGYLDLARGGTTVSALLLVVGYVVMVPWAILASGRRRVRQQ